MKTIYQSLFLILIATSLLLSCEDYLTEDPPSELSLTNINNDNLEGIITGVYEPLTRSRGRLWETNFLIALTLQEEVSNAQQGNTNLGLLANYTFEPPSGTITSPWPTFYQAVGRANILLTNLQTNTIISEATKNAAIGEASFVRAIVYYNLVRAYGSVPMRLVPVTNAQETGQALEPIDNIYAQIIADLQVAEANLPVTTTKPGRATQGAAKLALADVYLTRGNYPLARDKSKEVIDNAATYGYALLNSFPDIFSPTTPTHTEDVFSLKFSQVVGFGNFINTNFAPSTPSSFARDAGIAARGLSRTGADEQAPLIGNWDDNDLRKAWTIYNNVTVGGNILTPSNFPVNCEFFYGKYRDADAVEETAAGNDFYLYRYADALLIFAEADNLANGGPSSEAYNAVNQIRRRAYGVPLNTPNATVDFPAGLDQTAFDNLVFQERGYEFMAEGKRWFDLVRTGRWETFIPAAGKPLPTSLTWPIPNSELNNNPAIN